ncbi:MAG: MFS transporter [Marinovum sp.]|nr:MFS transporter [Marinovum sp.]
MISRDDIWAARAALAAFAVIGIGWGGFAALVPVIKIQSDAGDAAFGLALLVAGIGTLAAMWLAPRAEGRLDHRAMVVFSIAMAVSFLSPGLVTGVVGLALAMLVVSGISVTLDVIMNARLSAIEAARRRPLMNFAHGVFSIAYAIAALLAGLGREAGGSPLMILTALGGLSLALCFVVAQDAPRQIALDDDGPSSRQTWLIWLAGSVMLLGFMAEQATEGWSALRLERDLGGGAVQGAFGPAILGLTMAIGRLGGQAMIHGRSELSVMAIAATMAAIGAAAAAWATGLALAYLGFALLGVGVSVIVPMAYSYTGKRVRDAARSQAIANVSVIGFAGFFIGPLAMGALAENYGLSASFTFIAVAIALIPLVFVPALFARERS